MPAGWIGSGLTERDSRAIRSALGAGEHLVVDFEYRGGRAATSGVQGVALIGCCRPHRRERLNKSFVKLFDPPQRL